MYTLQYILSNIVGKPLLLIIFLSVALEIWRGRHLDPIIYICTFIKVQVDYFKLLGDETKEMVEHILVKNVIEKRPFKYDDQSFLYPKIWQEIIADVNLQVRDRYNNKYYNIGDIEAAKDRFFGIMNIFSKSVKEKEHISLEDFTNWEKVLLIARNMYEEDSCNEKNFDEKY